LSVALAVGRKNVPTIKNTDNLEQIVGVLSSFPERWARPVWRESRAGMFPGNCPLASDQFHLLSTADKYYHRFLTVIRNLFLLSTYINYALTG
jgi:hypothetical protein